MKLDRRPYSYKNDGAVPEFPDAGPVAVLDAQCALCSRCAKWIARNDKAGEFRLIPLQSALGHALMIHYGLDPSDPVSWLYLEDGYAYTSLGAIIRIDHRLGGYWKFLSVLKILPLSLQNTLYSFFARNRYRYFGKADLCNLPDPKIKEKLLS